MFSSSECIIWFAAFLAVAVAIVTVNLLSIILFIKNSNLRTHGMYLVINLTVVDILVGGISTINLLSINTYIGCKTAVIVRLPWEGKIITFFYFLLVSSNLSYKHDCNVVRADSCNISSIQASRYQKMGLRGNNFYGLGFSWDDINCHFNASLIRQRRFTQSVFMAIILLVMSFYYLCLLRLSYCQNLLWGASSAPWCSP